AQILGRAGSKAAGAGKAIETAIEKWRKTWDERRKTMAQRNEVDKRLVDLITPCLESLMWAAGRLGVAQDALRDSASAWPEDRYWRPVRIEAVAARGNLTLTKPTVATLEEAATGNDAEVRTMAASVLGQKDPQDAARLAERVLDDAASFNRLAAKGAVPETTLRS